MRKLIAFILLLSVSMLGQTYNTTDTIFTGNNQYGLSDGVYNPATCANSTKPSWCSGSDMGAWINAAYSNSTNNAKIHIPRSNGCYQYSTAISLATSGKAAKLYGDGIDSTCLQYTGSGGTAITLEMGNTTSSAGSIEDMLVYSTVSGQTATGISIGPSNDCSNCRLDRVRVAGFKTEVLSQTYGVKLNDSNLDACSSAASSIGFEDTSNGADDNKFSGGIIQGCVTLIYHNTTNPLWLNQLQLTGSSITTTWLSSGGNVQANQVHWVNPSTGGTTNFISSTNSFTILNSIFEDNKTSGSLTSFGSTSAGVGVIIGSAFLTSGETVTEAMQYTSSAQGYIAATTVSDSAKIPLLYNIGQGNVYNLGWPSNLGTGGILPPPLVTNLGNFPGCASAAEGARAIANNLNAACSAGATPASGGSTHCECYCNGSAWVETGR